MTLLHEKSLRLNAQDPLKDYRNQFHLPIRKNGEPFIYFCGNSLGLQPKATRAAIEQELLDWQNLGVEGHTDAQNPWMPYHEFLNPAMAKIVGAKDHEVVVMNTLSVNLHLLMVSFYTPSKERFKILIEGDAFPSDRYAVESQIAFHGYDVKESLLELKPRDGEMAIRPEDIASKIEQHGNEIALVILGNPNYYTGQVFDMATITKLAHGKGSKVGFDLAHGAGNLLLNLHEDGPDFALWCTYKYLNSGPGSLGGCFIHERHAKAIDLPRFTGWWGHKKATRFNMRHSFNAIEGAEGWQLSNPPILSMAAIKASIELFDEVGMPLLRKKAIALTNFLEECLLAIDAPALEIITPRASTERGCQLSIRVKEANKSLYDAISAKGVIADWREPDVIRVAPVPFYNTFEEVFQFAQFVKQAINGR